MTKAEYMNTLREKLQRYNRTLETEILEDYEQHFAEGLAEGRTEEEIIAELGNIEDMLQEFSEEDLKQEMAAVESQASQSNSYEQLYREVVIDGQLADVEVRCSQDDQLRIDYENRGSKSQKLRYHFYQYEENGVFYAGVKERKGTDFCGDIGSESIWDMFSHLASRSGGDIDLRIEIPAGIPVVKLHTSSGDLDIREIQTQELEAQCASGDLQIEDVVCKKLYGKTQSGDMEVSGVAMNIQEDTEIELCTSSGEMEVRRVSAARMRMQTTSGDLSARELETEQLKVQTASGEQELENTVCKKAALRSGSGDIDLHNIRGKELTAEAGSGEVNLQADMESYEVRTGSGDIAVTAGADARQIRLNAGSGSVCLDMGRVEGATIETRTGSGDRRIRGCKVPGLSYGNGACQVKIATGSGDIEVE